MAFNTIFNTGKYSLFATRRPYGRLVLYCRFDAHPHLFVYAIEHQPHIVVGRIRQVIHTLKRVLALVRVLYILQPEPVLAAVTAHAAQVGERLVCLLQRHDGVEQVAVIHPHIVHGGEVILVLTQCKYRAQLRIPAAKE